MKLGLLRGRENENGNVGIKSVSEAMGAKISKINVFSYNSVVSGSLLT